MVSFRKTTKHSNQHMGKGQPLSWLKETLQEKQTTTDKHDSRQIFFLFILNWSITSPPTSIFYVLQRSTRQGHAVVQHLSELQRRLLYIWTDVRFINLILVSLTYHHHFSLSLHPCSTDIERRKVGNRKHKIA
jgi:hypothetical protein